MARVHVQIGVHEYAHQRAELGSQHLKDAIRLDPATWRDSPALANLVRNYAVLIGKARGDAAAEAFLNDFFGNLPLELEGVRHLRSTVLGDAHIELAFLCHQRGESRLVAKHVLRGLSHKPQWLRNRGVLSIAVRSMFGSGA